MIDWKKEAKDQTAHLVAGLLACWLVAPVNDYQALILVVFIWAAREHAQHKFHFTDGSFRDLIGWLIGSLIYMWIW